MLSDLHSRIFSWFLWNFLPKIEVKKVREKTNLFPWFAENACWPYFLRSRTSLSLRIQKVHFSSELWRPEATFPINFQDNFSSVGLSFVKVFVMMVGEMDYSDILTSNVVNEATVPGTNIPYVPLPTLSYIMFMLFVLSVSIILMNLLVSLLSP